MLVEQAIDDSSEILALATQGESIQTFVALGDFTDDYPPRGISYSDSTTLNFPSYLTA